MKLDKEAILQRAIEQGERQSKAELCELALAVLSDSEFVEDFVLTRRIVDESEKLNADGAISKKDSLADAIMEKVDGFEPYESSSMSEAQQNRAAIPGLQVGGVLLGSLVFIGSLAIRFQMDLAGLQETASMSIPEYLSALRDALGSEPWVRFGTSQWALFGGILLALVATLNVWSIKKAD